MLARLHFARIFSLVNEEDVRLTDFQTVNAECNRFRCLLPELNQEAQEHLSQANLRVLGLAVIAGLAGEVGNNDPTLEM